MTVWIRTLLERKVYKVCEEISRGKFRLYSRYFNVISQSSDLMSREIWVIHLGFASLDYVG